jgi:hypothetical protein
MKVLSDRDIRNLNVGDKVIYKERNGDLSPFFYKAKVIAKYKYFLELSCAADQNPFNDYEDATRYFNTSYSYNDSCDTYSGYRLYKYESMISTFREEY